ncbi:MULTISPECIES: IclR family transcriptional regulator [Thalassospira]|uniref:IclR family transcriptional regulator n=1 Tax=Thalassospira aquimaris TaxID=3037796 RepID=A0ABT6G789_9PROT|nr:MULTISPECIES: IclR family transcriptional regulator [Thalassospira]MDG4717913.1 IclR family transcriptional regulator [Thalassospira sp. FZY0004]
MAVSTKTKKNADDKPAEKGGIQSLERASMLLDLVASAGPDGMPLTELSERSGLHSSTAFHLIRTLENVGFLTKKDDSKRYLIGSKIFMLAAGAMNENALLLEGTPVLAALSDKTGEASHLAVRSNSEIVLVARMAAKGMLQMSERTGAVRPAHATAIGKILFSQCNEAELEQLLSDIDFRAYTDNTLTSAAKLRRELTDIRKNNVAHDRCELDPDVRCIAVPVYDFAGRCVAAMGVSGPVWRMSEDIIPQRIEELKTAAATLSKALGATF